MKRITITALALALMLCAGCVTKIATAQDELPTAEYESTFMQVRDVDEPAGAVRIAAEIEQREAEQAAAEAEAIEQDYSADWEYYEESYYEPTSYGGDGFAQEGVRYHDGRTETYYSSNVLYHYRTGEWTVDDEGYYRDSDGYYVVAASDIAEGETLETSKGTAKVYDSGCDDGVTDFYTAF